MYILKKLSQNRRDFTAKLKCEFCGREALLTSGYDDDYYHKNVIPKMKCKSCDKESGTPFQPAKTVYPEGFQV